MNITKPFSGRPMAWNIAFGLLCALPLLLVVTRAGADIALCMIAMLFLWHSMQNADWRWTEHPEIRVLAVLWCVMCLVSWFSPMNPQASFTAALSWGRFVLFFAAVRYWLLIQPSAWEAINTIGLGILLLVAMHVWWQYAIYPPGSRLMVPFSYNPNIGQYMLKIGLPMLGLAMYRILISDQKHLWWLPMVGLLATISLIMLSGERSTAILTLLGLGILTIILLVYQRQARMFVSFIGLGVATLLAVLASTQTIIQQRGAYFVEQIADFWNTVYGQLFIGAWRLWERYPLTGVGMKQFWEACQEGNLGTTYCDSHPHNAYLSWLVETGVICLLLLIAALVLMAKRLRRELVFSGNQGILAAFICAGFIILIFPLTVTQSPFSNWPAILHWYSLSLVLSMTSMVKQGP